MIHSPLKFTLRSMVENLILFQKSRKKFQLQINILLKSDIDKFFIKIYHKTHICWKFFFHLYLGKIR